MAKTILPSGETIEVTPEELLRYLNPDGIRQMFRQERLRWNLKTSKDVDYIDNTNLFKYSAEVHNEGIYQRMEIRTFPDNGAYTGYAGINNDSGVFGFSHNAELWDKALSEESKNAIVNRTLIGAMAKIPGKTGYGLNDDGVPVTDSDNRSAMIQFDPYDGRAYLLSNDDPNYVNNELRQKDIRIPERAVARIGDIPTRITQLMNDLDFVSDPDYRHTDNNFTNSNRYVLDNLDDRTFVYPEISKDKNGGDFVSNVRIGLNGIPGYGESDGDVKYNSQPDLGENPDLGDYGDRFGEAINSYGANQRYSGVYREDGYMPGIFRSLEELERVDLVDQVMTPLTHKDTPGAKRPTNYYIFDGKWSPNWFDRIQYNDSYLAQSLNPNNMEVVLEGREPVPYNKLDQVTGIFKKETSDTKENNKNTEVETVNPEDAKEETSTIGLKTLSSAKLKSSTINMPGMEGPEIFVDPEPTVDPNDGKEIQPGLEGPGFESQVDSSETDTDTEDNKNTDGDLGDKQIEPDEGNDLEIIPPVKPGSETTDPDEGEEKEPEEEYDPNKGNDTDHSDEEELTTFHRGKLYQWRYNRVSLKYYSKDIIISIVESGEQYRVGDRLRWSFGDDVFIYEVEKVGPDGQIQRGKYISTYERVFEQDPSTHGVGLPFANMSGVGHGALLSVKCNATIETHATQIKNNLYAYVDVTPSVRSDCESTWSDKSLADSQEGKITVRSTAAGPAYSGVNSGRGGPSPNPNTSNIMLSEHGGNATAGVHVHLFRYVINTQNPTWVIRDGIQVFTGKWVDQGPMGLERPCDIKALLFSNADTNNFNNYYKFMLDSIIDTISRNPDSSISNNKNGVTRPYLHIAQRDPEWDQKFTDYRIDPDTGDIKEVDITDRVLYINGATGIMFVYNNSWKNDPSFGYGMRPVGWNPIAGATTR